MMVPPHSPPTNCPSVPVSKPNSPQLSFQIRTTIGGTSPIHSTVTSIGVEIKTGDTSS